MKTFKTIFIKSFIVLSCVLLVLTLLAQYVGQGKIELKNAALFSFPLALLVSALATLFIGGIRKLEAEPPSVQPAEYLQVDDKTIKDKLTKMRRKRALLFLLFLMWIPYGMAILALNLPPFFILGYMAALAIYGFILQFVKCPRCGHYFQFIGALPGHLGDTGNEKINLLFGGGYRNFLANKCLNCGLSINAKKE